MAVLKQNLVANYLGQGWTALMGLAFVPVYIKYLGIEAYGLIGVFALLQAWLTLLDMGITPTLSREMGRYLGGASTTASIRNLLRSMEVIAVLIALGLVAGVWVASGWLASGWLQVESIPLDEVSGAFKIMGAVVALRFLEGIYRSCLLGLQRQVLFNLVNSLMATVRAVGAVVVLAYWSPTVEAFFYWQLLVSVIGLLALLAVTYSCIETSSTRAQFSWEEVEKVRRFAGGMLGITFLTLLLTQMDKILLSNLLTLSAYGYYALASLVAGGLYILLTPIVQAWFPLLSQLHASGSKREFAEAYHLGAQLVSVVMGSAALVLIVFADPILQLWTQDAELAKQSAGLVRWLALGNLLNGIMTIPYQAQLAYGWTGYAIRVNAISVVLVIPAIMILVPIYGAVGAAIVWVCLNAGYIIFGAYYMYSKILTQEKVQWYVRDTLQPLLFGGAVALLTVLLPTSEKAWQQILEIFLVALCILVASACGAEKIREQVLSSLRSARRAEL